MSVSSIVKQNKYYKGANISREMFRSFLEEHSINKEINENKGVFDLFNGINEIVTDKSYVDYVIRKISSVDNLPNILDHACLFEDTNGERLFVYQPYKTIDHLEEDNYIEGLPLSKWCEERGLTYQAFEDSWYNPNKTILVIIKVADEELLEKFVLNSFEAELYHKENLFCPRTFEKTYENPLYAYTVEQTESFHDWFVKTVLLIETIFEKRPEEAEILYKEMRTHLKHLSPFILSNIGFPKKEQEYNKLINYLTHLPVFSSESEYRIAFHYLYGVYTSLEYYSYTELYKTEFSKEFSDELSKEQISFLLEVIDQTRFL